MVTKIRPTIVAAVLVISLVAFFGIQYVVKTYRFEEPFKEKVLSISGVQSVRLSDEANEMKIYLTMESGADVQKTFEQVNNLAEAMLKGNTAIEIEDKASLEMAEYYQQMQYSIYEGIASGRFTVMADQLKAIASALELDQYSLQVDNHYVYLKLVDNGEVFVKVVPRSSGRVAYQNTLEGGESQW